MFEALGSFVVVMLLYTIATRLPPPRQSVPKFVVIGGAVELGLAVWLFQVYGLTITTWAGLLLLAMLCELYVFCATLTMSSVSVRLLLLLRRGPITISAYTSEVDPESPVTRRIKILLANGFLEDGPGRPRLTAKGRRTLLLFNSLRSLFRPH